MRKITNIKNQKGLIMDYIKFDTDAAARTFKFLTEKTLELPTYADKFTSAVQDALFNGDTATNLYVAAGVTVLILTGASILLTKYNPFAAKEDVVAEPSDAELVVEEVSLRNGGSAPKALVSSTMQVLKRLFSMKDLNSLLALHDLKTLATDLDPAYPIPPSSKDLLEKLGLLDYHGKVHRGIRPIIISAIGGNWENIYLVNPVVSDEVHQHDEL